MRKWTKQAAQAATVVAACALWPGLAHAGVADFIRSQTQAQGHALVEAARAMPADKYGYKPENDPMNFGELMLHVAVGNYLFCSRIGAAAEPALPALAANGPKDAIVRRLQDSFDFCTRALATLTDARMAEALNIGTTKTPRSMAILTLTGTWNSHLTMAQDDLAQNGQKTAAAAP